jgi:2,3-bisphosphoglycerate-independent phosphoglycerate mutase
MRFEKPAGPVVLCILDGFGEAPAGDANAISLAAMPNYDRLIAENVARGPRAFLETSGLSVGLPEGQMGNSEVGHMNIGAGRVVMQDLPRIDASIASGDIAEAKAFRELIDTLKETGGACHLMGLMSPGGVHSHQDHMVALAKIMAAEGIKVHLHAFMDGRDTPPKSGRGFLQDFVAKVGTAATVATMTGRYFAMDRDKNWDRVEGAYRAITSGEGELSGDFSAALATAYAKDTGDEFVVPHVAEGYEGVREGDGLLMANFRADRVREILTALVDPAFDGFARTALPAIAARVGLTEYSDALSLHMTAIFPSTDTPNTLGACVAAAGLRQLRIAETEKYAHVTFFLNGGREAVFEGEDRKLIPSPKVATYDLQPEMSAPEVTDELVEAIEGNQYDLIIVNFANPDMVGHTGVIPAAIKAVEAIDACLGRLDVALGKAGGVMLVCADHGNIECMRDPDTGSPHTAHTIGQVPFFMVGADALPTPAALTSGRLADLAPTLLTLLGLDIPDEMTGSILLAPVVETARNTDKENRLA